MAAASSLGLITSNGKAISTKPWGLLPRAYGSKKKAGEDDDESEDDESSSEEESSDEEAELDESKEGEEGQMLPPPLVTLGIDLRKPGDETPIVTAGGPPKQLYLVLRHASVEVEGDAMAVFASNHVYVVSGAGPGLGVPDGVASDLGEVV